jgi:hypothetical protein
MSWVMQTMLMVVVLVVLVVAIFGKDFESS